MKTKHFIWGCAFAAGISHVHAQEVRKETRGDQDFIVYKVQKGETVYGISKKYKISQEKFIETNPAIAKVIKEGDIVYIPNGAPYNPKLKEQAPAPDEEQIVVEYTKHKVAKGQGLMQIARQYNITVEEIRKWNDLDDKKTIVPDQELIVGISTSKSSKKNNENKNTTAQNKSMERPSDKTVIKNPKTDNGKSRGDEEERTILTHQVTAGETLYSIAKKYGVTDIEIMNANNLSSKTVKADDKLVIYNAKKNPTETPVTQPENPANPVVIDESTLEIYTIADGDNLNKIQDKFNVRRTEIRYWNGMIYEKGSESHKNQITAGDHLRIYRPKKLTHIVQGGENAKQIAAQYDVSGRQIEIWNNIKMGELSKHIIAGKALTIYQPTGPKPPKSYEEGLTPAMTPLGSHTPAPTPNPQKTEETFDPALFDKKQHTVSEGQTFSQIANIYAVYGVTLAKLKSWNQGIDYGKLALGQQIIVYVPKNAMPQNNTVTNPQNNTNPVAETPKKVYPANNPDTTPKVKENTFDKNKSPEVDLNDFWNQPKEEPKKETPKPKEEAKVIPPSNTETEVTRGVGTNPYQDNAADANLTGGAATLNPNPIAKEGNGDIVETGTAQVLQNINSPLWNAATHRTLPVGSVVFVKNTINNKTLNVQIAAPMNINEVTDKQVILQLTQTAFEKLGAGNQHNIEIQINYPKR